METVELLDKYFETAFAAQYGIKRLREEKLPNTQSHFKMTKTKGRA
jgi:hypothetical protein